MKKAARLISILILLACFAITLDLWLTRGYFSADFLISSYTAEKGTPDIDKNVSYTIESIDADNYQLTFQNKSFLPKFFLVYRNDEFFFFLDPASLFSHANRVRFNYASDPKEQGIGFDCGTGLGLISINPFETFTLTKPKKELIDWCHSNDLTTRIDNTYYSRIDHKPLYTLNATGEVDWLRNMESFKDDSVSVQLFLPLIECCSGTQQNIYSNPVKVSYFDLIEKEQQ